MVHILGLTGSIGTGKSTVSHIFKRLKLPVFDADKAVNTIYQYDTVFFDFVKTTYPHYIIDNKIDKVAISKQAFFDKNLLLWLKARLHSRVRMACYDFIKEQQAKKKTLVVLDIPLLFEAGFHTLCHTIVVTHCDAVTQEKRVLKRPHMSLEKFKAIQKCQWPDDQKKQEATWILSTNGTPLSLIKQLRTFFKTCGDNI